MDNQLLNLPNIQQTSKAYRCKAGLHLGIPSGYCQECVNNLKSPKSIDEKIGELQVLLYDLINLSSPAYIAYIIIEYFDKKIEFDDKEITVIGMFKKLINDYPIKKHAK